MLDNILGVESIVDEEETPMIRAAAKNDLDAVYCLMQQLSSHDFTKEQFESCFQQNLDSSYIMVYEEDGCVNGCGVLNIQYPLHFSQKKAEVVNLIVDANARGKGIGKKILHELVRIAALNDCVRIEVASNRRRTDAHRFYIREGFDDTHLKLTKGLA